MKHLNFAKKVRWENSRKVSIPNQHTFTAKRSYFVPSQYWSDICWLSRISPAPHCNCHTSKKPWPNSTRCVAERPDWIDHDQCCATKQQSSSIPLSTKVLPKRSTNKFCIPLVCRIDSIISNFAPPSNSHLHLSWIWSFHPGHHRKSIEGAVQRCTGEEKITDTKTCFGNKSCKIPVGSHKDCTCTIASQTDWRDEPRKVHGRPKNTNAS